MLTLKVLSRLLCYPTAELTSALPDMQAVIAADTLLAAKQKQDLQTLLAELQSGDPYELQERYVALFDRGRALSLHLFEHVHGESRDRGQAMVDLADFYAQHGYQIDARELPDYLPLFLEFLAELPADAAMSSLQDTAPVLALLSARLQERRSAYQAVFDALVQLADATDAQSAARTQAANEGPDETLTRMDEIWEEEAVSFMASQLACNASSTAPKPKYKIETINITELPTESGN